MILPFQEEATRTARSGRSEGGADAERPAFKGCPVLPPLLPAAPSPSQSVSYAGSRWGSLLPSTCLSGPLRSFWRPHPFPLQLGPASRHPFPQSPSRWPHLCLSLLRPEPPGCPCPAPRLPLEQARAAHSPLGTLQSFPRLGLGQSFHPGIPAPFFFFFHIFLQGPTHVHLLLEAALTTEFIFILSSISDVPVALQQAGDKVNKTEGVCPHEANLRGATQERPRKMRNGVKG